MQSTVILPIPESKGGRGAVDIAAAASTMLHTLGRHHMLGCIRAGERESLALIVPTIYLEDHGVEASCRLVALTCELAFMIAVDEAGTATLVEIPSLRRTELGYWYQIEAAEARMFTLWVTGCGGVWTTDCFLKEVTADEG